MSVLWLATPGFSRTSNDGWNCTGEPAPCKTQAEYIGYNIICPIICILGIACNILNIMVFQQSKFQVSASTRTYLLGLAVSDLLAAIVHLTAVLTICQPAQPSFYQLTYHNFFTTPVVNYFINVDIWLTLAIAVDRYIYITNRTHVRCVCAAGWAKGSCWIIGVVALFFNVPYYFYRYVTIDTTIEYTEFGKSLLFDMFIVLRQVCVAVIPLTSVVILNGLLVYYTCLHQSALNNNSVLGHVREETTERRNRQHFKRVALIISVTIVYVLAHAGEPFVHPRMFIFMFGPCSIFTDTYHHTRMVFDILQKIPFTSTFISMIVCLDQYRKTLYFVLSNLFGVHSDTLSSQDTSSSSP